MIPKLTVFMIMSPSLDRNDSPLFCIALPGTDFIAQMLPCSEPPIFGVFAINLLCVSACFLRSFTWPCPLLPTAAKIKVTRRRMARERRGAGSSLVSMETQY